MEKTSVTLPEDLIIQILIRMPLKSLVQCTCSSKTLASLIRRKDFIDGYLVRSMERPRLLFIDFVSGKNNVLFHSVYQEEKPLLSSGQQHVCISQNRGCRFSHPIRGLVCVQENNTVMICNPGTKKLVTLPEVQRRKGAAITSFLGYDEVADVFKVLCMTKIELDLSVEAKEHQVLTVGSGQNSWTPINCEHHHCPVTQGLCERGVLYYGAWSNTEEYLLMSFNVSSEKFTVIELPEGFYIHPRCNLVNYNGKIAIVDNNKFESSVRESNENIVLEIWVQNETERNWSRLRIDIPSWKETFWNRFIFKGTIRSGKLVFASDNKQMRSLSVLYYDESTKDVTKSTIEGVDEGEKHIFQTSLDHIDSPLHI